jgi:hypothetical protein
LTSLKKDTKVLKILEGKRESHKCVYRIRINKWKGTGIVKKMGVAFPGPQKPSPKMKGIS